MTPSVHLDEPPVPYKKRRCRSSKKKRLRLKKRASLEPKVAVEGDEIADNKDDETPTEERTQSQGSSTEEPQPQEPEQEQEATDRDHTQKQEETHVQGQNHTVNSRDGDDDDEAEAEEQEEMTEYERKRRANILRNQAYMKGVGMSIAKLAARTTIGNEAEKEAARLRRAEKRALRAAQQPEPVPQRLSLRIKMKPYSEHVRAKARMMAYMGVNGRKGAVHDQDEVKGTQTHGNTTKEREEAMEPTHKRSEDTVSTQNYMQKKSASTATRPIRTTKDTFQGGRHEPDATKSYDLQAAQRDAFANRIACMARKPVNMTMNTMSTDSPVIEPPCRDDSSVQLQQHEEASPQRQTATSPAESQGSNKQVSGPSKELEHQAGKKEHDEMAGYERKRRQDILRNQLFMQQVGGKSVSKFIACTAIRREAEKETRRFALNAKRSALNTAESDPRRPTRKLRRLGTEHDVEVSELDRGHPLDLLTLKTTRQRHGNKVEFMDAMDEEGKVFLENLTAHFKIPVALEEKAPLTDVKYSLEDKDIAKVVPDPIRALAFLPRPDRIMVASGDKEGHIALWTPPSTADHMKRNSCAVLYRPHGFPVSQLLFPDSTSLISSSYDGTVREFDLWTSTLSVVCETGIGVSALAASGNPQFYYAGCGDGTLRLIDRRARKLDRTGYQLHEARINTLDQHPSLDYCIATASQDNTVCFWDKRRISPELNVPLATLPHADAVDSAYFSPRNGAWLATVSQDSYINVYDTSILSTRKSSDPLPVQLPSPVRTQHNNYSGSWKGTKFVLHAAWDPKRTNQFVIGCMETPPRVQIFHAERHQTIRELMCSKLGTTNNVNVFHPHLDLIASGNTSGRVSLWRGKGEE
ncbi:WD repeat-containing protein 76 [Phytophthora pseudosyringae]|uniref:WD repeat-containing protein 76 n=1 Tax=Phytophthora pseudosyringae TaxID=221518 RepID=A0A8T1WGV1_9STRA|nr:WD repeat-containing protein 76 [Phytophthora pseudosyringae]